MAKIAYLGLLEFRSKLLYLWVLQL